MIDTTKSDTETLEIVHEAVGHHLLLTLRACGAKDLLNDSEALCRLARQAAEATNATVLDICVQKFSPQGVTVVAVLAESHASLHTYPESNLVFWDCFTCGSTCKPENSIEVLREALRPQEISSQIVFRS